VNLKLETLSRKQWSNLSSKAHLACFGLERDEDMDRIDFALFVHNDKEPCCYATVIEIDKESVYMQHGGALPSIGKTVHVFRGYSMMIGHLKQNYKNISTKVLNKNYPMIKMAMAVGLDIVGIEMNDGEIFLGLMWKKH
jgi:hypothetical protein